LARSTNAVEADLEMLRKRGADYVPLPAHDDSYSTLRYRVTETAETAEGAHRPHFDAVLTVVLKLLLIAAADRAYFGEKDWQQLQLVRGLAEAFFLSTAVVPCETVREGDGLALSSRNRRLSAADRMKAPAFHRALVGSATPDDAARSLRTSGFAVDTWKMSRRRLAQSGWEVRLIDNAAEEDSISR
jgi:pantoate--beta-alanine ligase